ncbi:magnesium and cobalt transport protein CorA [Sinorhizobium mexicanum]|uniref:Magnesium and cobalt transport protein CorA n=1 Tax=Sinorhizobium mexicanum TaxID=375549 RepID=A0A859QF95_9HYPH|nr:magnesium and cobalt transport protein CorA [Sinorhizobium mexicanum]MBP1882432.1 magnesium transporter [Sinorhizobium mexicanum]QLL62124.1 magnesium and cobalt transport protein CorA [Sinorhizobium mexicanum]
MTVVASFVYRDGKRAEELPLSATPTSFEENEFVWIGLYAPTAEEMATLENAFALHHLAVEDALSPHQIPKVEIYGEQLFIIAKTAHIEGDKIVYGQTAVFVGRNHIISVRQGSARAHTELRSQLEASPKLLQKGTDYVLHAIIDFIVDGYLPVVQTIEDKVLAMEKHMLVAFLERDEIRRIFRMRRQVILFQRILGPMSEVASKLTNLDLPCIDDHAKPYFRDVLDHVRRTEVMVNGLREVITSVFEASNLLEQQRQGTITRQLAAWAAILAVPTAIAGIYGMNFRNMPELDTRYGYFAVLATIAVLCVLLFVRFRKAGWL